MMKMFTQTNGLKNFSQLTNQVGVYFGLFLFLFASSAFGQTCYTLTVTGGSYPSEVSWNLLNADGIVTSGFAPIEGDELCLEDGCYTLEMFDSWGDGWNGFNWTLTHVDTIFGDLVVGPFSLASGYDGTVDFSQGDVVCSVFGCTDEGALNFNPEANEDDGSCEFPVLVDCAQAFSDTYCYVNNDNSSWVYIGGDGSTLNLSFLIGEIEGSIYDNITIYDGDSDAAPVLFTSEGLGYGVDLADVSVNSTGDAILMTMYSEGSYSCEDGFGGFDAWEWEVSCGASYDCQELEANIGEACDDGNPATYDDMVSDLCECAGIPFDCEELLADIGDACDDEDENTSLDSINENCECAGVPAPENNECDQAPLLVCGVSTSGTTVGASPAPEGLAFCGAGSTTAPGVWYTYFAIADNPTIIDLAGSSFDTKLFVYTGLCGDLECLAGNDDFGGPQSQVSFEASAGTYYYVFVTGYGSNSGDYQISINCGFDCDEQQAYFGDACDDEDPTTENDIINEDCECVGTPLPPAPENDLVCDAIPVICGDIVDGTTINATNDAMPFCGTSNSAPGVWYNLPIDFNGTVNLSTCNTASYDTKISVFEADACDGELACVGGNDDGTGCAGFTSQLEFDVTDGQNLYVLVHGFSTASGDFTLAITCVEGVDCPELGLNIGAACDDGNENTINDTVSEDCGCVGIEVPENDLCENAIELECGDLVSGNNSAASNTHNKCNGSSGGKDVWYTFTPEVNMTVSLETCLEGTEFDTDLSVFTGSCDELVCEESFGGNGHIDGSSGCEFASWASTGDFVALAGIQYTIQLTGYMSGYEGNFALSISCAPIFDCLELEANVGDACDDENADTENDLVNENCGCEGTPVVVEPGCQNWAMFINDNEGGETDIYGVNLDGGSADLTYITTIGFHAHMAFNPADNLLYVVKNNGSQYVTVNANVAVPVVSEPILLGESVPSITTAAFAPNGKLLIGSSTQDIIYSVDISDNSVSVFDAYAPISGGDIAFDSAGMLYLATRSGNALYEVYPDDVWDDQYIGSLSNLVTGMALTSGEQLLTSHNGNADLKLSNLDGSDAGITYPLMLDGEAFMHHNGDLASGCNSYLVPEEGDCEAFSTYYADINRPGVSGTDLYAVDYTAGGNAIMTFLTNVSFSAHIAYDGQSDIVYLVNQNGSFVRAYDPTAGIFLGDLPLVGASSGTVTVAYNPADGLLYIGAGSTIKTVDLGTGIATNVATGPISGGDLAFQDGKLYLATRSGSKLHEIVGGVAVEVGSIPELVNGMAQANNATDLVMANKLAGVFTKVLAADGSTVGTYVPMINGEAITLYDGDMAAGCADDQEVVVPGGQCYATEVIEYVEGSALGGGSIPANRADATQALGAPERVDELVFVALGYGGSLTVAFDGAVPNGEGDDIEVVEVSYNNPGCDAYPEYADVSVSMDGIEWFSAGTVCKGEPFVDISDAGDFEYVMFVRITNLDDVSTSSDGFDVDGIVALHNCEEDGSEEGGNDVVVTTESNNTLTSYPNPTAGPSQVVFVTAATGYTMLEVYDMNGRNVETLFSQVAQQGQEYRIDFDGTDLPNGIYVYRMTTDNETTVDKFMVTK